MTCLYRLQGSDEIANGWWSNSSCPQDKASRGGEDGDAHSIRNKELQASYNQIIIPSDYIHSKE